MRRLKLFHQDLLTVRSHQWKYYVEPYVGCAMRCTYCLHWQAPAFVENLYSDSELLPEVARDLDCIARKQIVYVGATIDPYQMLEKKVQATRQILEMLVRRQMPAVILTKSPLILRDLDLLLELNSLGLVLVQFTVLTVDEHKARAIERSAPSVAERLRAASELSSAGIPVHFHLSPLIPGLYDDGELEATVAAIAANGGACIYSNILGMRHVNTEVWSGSAAEAGLRPDERIRAAFSRPGDSAKSVYSPDVDLICEEMSRLRDACLRNRIDFISEFIPGLDAFDASRFKRGIFRFGLPTVYQMLSIFDERSELASWVTFSEYLRLGFAAVDDDYLALVKKYWDDGQLFQNTTIASENTGGRRRYFQTGRLQLDEGVLAWD
jgi:DNA repair photolyase